MYNTCHNLKFVVHSQKYIKHITLIWIWMNLFLTIVDKSDFEMILYFHELYYYKFTKFLFIQTNLDLVCKVCFFFFFSWTALIWLFRLLFDLKFINCLNVKFEIIFHSRRLIAFLTHNWFIVFMNYVDVTF